MIRWLQSLAYAIFKRRSARSNRELKTNGTISESEEWLRSFIEQMPESVSMIDEQGTITEWNPASEQLTGIPRTEALGQPYWDLMFRLAPQERRTEAGYTQLKERLQEALRTGWSSLDGPSEYEVQHSDGSRRISRQIVCSIKTTRGYCLGSLAQDVTELKQAEQALRESEARFRSIVEHTTDAIVLCDTEGRIIEWNQAAENLTGLKRADVLDCYYWDVQGQLFPPEHQTAADQERFRTMVLEGLQTGQAPWMNRPLEGRFVRTDGTHLHFQQVVFPVPTQNGFMIGSITRDVSEHVRADQARQEAEQRLRQREELYRQAIAAADAVPYYIDVDTNSYAFMGEGIQEITGYTAAEMTPDLYRSLLCQVRMRGAMAALSCEQARELFMSGRIKEWKADVELKTRSGERRWLADSAIQVFDEQGRLIGANGILQDVTERKQAEEAVQQLNVELEQRVSERTAQLQESEKRFRALFESSWEGIILWRRGGTIVDCNPTACRMNGYSREELIGRSVDMLNVNQLPEESKQAIHERLRQGEHFNIEVEHRRKDGTIFPIETEISMVILDDQELIMGFDRDITARKQAEQELKQAVQALEAANKELESFSYSVSHDLRAPLRAIDGFSRILLDDYAAQLDPTARRYLDLVCENTRHMGRLIDDLLAFSRLGRQELHKQLTFPADLVRQVLDEMRAECRDREVDIVINDLPPCHADPALLRQVYTNLLSNALKFTRSRQRAQIEVGCVEGLERVYFVRDNGVGFDQRYADKLFGVFQRLHSPREYEGTGVGLAIVQRVIHRHGGRVWVEAQVDKGATFFFTL